MEVKGKIYMIGETQVITEKFKKREFVIETEDKYPQKILLQLTQDKCSILDNYREGQQIEASFNLRGREWIDPKKQAKYFNTLDVWKIETLGQNREMGGIEKNFQEEQIQTQQNQIEDESDLPF